MPSFGDRSRKALETCHPDLILILGEAIKYYDFSVIYGHRSIELQQTLYAKGRTTKGPKVTNCDGLIKKSNHNFMPSHAVDIIPYPGGYQAGDDEFHYMAGVVMGVADKLFIEGKVSHRIKWGGRWVNFKDHPHFELIL